MIIYKKLGKIKRNILLGQDSKCVSENYGPDLKNLYKLMSKLAPQNFAKMFFTDWKKKI